MNCSTPSVRLRLLCSYLLNFLNTATDKEYSFYFKIFSIILFFELSSKYPDLLVLASPPYIMEIICNTLYDLVSSVKFYKREKHA